MKKIIIYSFIFSLILAIILFGSYILLHKKVSPENNSVKIIKNSEIVKNSENPGGIFNDDNNIEENKFSGVFINKNTIITVAHGVNTENSNYKIYDNFGNTYSGKLLKKDNENDYAFLETNIDFEKFRETKIGKDLKIGEEIYAIIYDEKLKLSKKIGSIKDINGNKIGVNMIFNPGDSGSPIYNNRDELIGIIEEVDLKNNIGYFLKISDFKN
ncbi:MAG: serine protease [Candidatus Gracilibacteria bacterium]|nr:serine protease [Candidatus Gracilibacteria bacterium]